MWLFTFKLIQIKQNAKFSSLVPPATFQELNTDMRLVAAVLDGKDVEHFHHRRKFCWTVLI